MKRGGHTKGKREMKKGSGLTKSTLPHTGTGRNKGGSRERYLSNTPREEEKE